MGCLVREKCFENMLQLIRFSVSFERIMNKKLSFSHRNNDHYSCMHAEMTWGHIEGLELKQTISTFFKKWAKCTFRVLSNHTLRV